MTVYRDDTVRIFVDHRAAGVHAEGTHKILELFGTVDYLALVQLVGKVCKYLIRKLNTDADINAVGHSGYFEVVRDLFHPLTAASAAGYHTHATCITAVIGGHGVAVAVLLHRCSLGVELKIHLLLKLVIKILKHDIVLVGTEMTHRCVKQIQSVLHTKRLYIRVGGGIELCALSAVGNIYFIHIMHKLERGLFADVIVQRTAELCGYVVFTVGKRSGSPLSKTII